MSDKLEIIADESISKDEIQFRVDGKTVGKVVNFSVNRAENEYHADLLIKPKPMNIGEIYSRYMGVLVAPCPLEAARQKIKSEEVKFKPYPYNGSPEVFK